jgi:hypothetical protein
MKVASTRWAVGLVAAMGANVLAGAVIAGGGPAGTSCDTGLEPGSEIGTTSNDPECYAVAIADPTAADTTVPDSAQYTITPLLSAGDVVPESSDPNLQYQMVGIPDGLGAYEDDGQITAFMNHELGNTVLSTPVLGQPQNRGAFVSKLTLDEEGNVLSAERAYDTVFEHEYPVGQAAVTTEFPAAQADNNTPGFARFCSGYLSVDDGFDRPIYFTNEESTGAATFDGTGGLAVAIFDNQLHTLPHLGRFSWENSLVMPQTGNSTVIIGMEDGPATPDNQLYMYVGQKVNSPDPLARNGLDNGDLYVFVSTTPGQTSEATFASGTISGRWQLIDNAANMSDVQLEAATDAIPNVMTFIRPEDGAFSPQHSNEFFFVTTGGNLAAGNELGRLYALRLNPGNVLQSAELRVVYNADQVIASGGDIAISPDNIDISESYLMINEDGTTQSRAVMGQKARDGSIWRFPVSPGNWEDRIDVDARERIVELDPPGRDGVAVLPGVWETSGVVDVAHVFGDDVWLFDVQAHAPTTAPGTNTVEDGQLVLMTPFVGEEDEAAGATDEDEIDAD